MRRLLLDWRALSGCRMGVVSTARSVPNRAESWERLPARPCAGARLQHPTRSGKDGWDADDDNLAPRRPLTNVNANVLHGGHVLAAHGHSQHRSHVSLWSERPTRFALRWSWTLAGGALSCVNPGVASSPDPCGEPNGGRCATEDPSDALLHHIRRTLSRRHERGIQ